MVVKFESGCEGETTGCRLDGKSLEWTWFFAATRVERLHQLAEVRRIRRAKRRQLAADLLGRSWFLPIAILVIVALLAIFDPGDGPMRAIPVCRDSGTSREALGLLWQVEGAILALVVAALLFVRV